ncbi:MAG: SRPBCC family protein [Acidobacteria bacterium]|nr:SRPBCC family protein [Acidobacteriota bacterium]
MELDSTFKVTAPIDAVWRTVMDVEQVATAVPGAEITEKLSDSAFKGVVTVKVGPLKMQYRGQIELVSRDDEQHVAVFQGKAQEKAGQGTADGSATMTLTQEGDETTGLVHVEVSLSGKAAAMGKGVINSVTQQIMKIFAGNLQTMMTEGDDAQPGEPGSSSVNGVSLVAGAIGSMFRRGDKEDKRADKEEKRADKADTAEEVPHA